jgi:hypothetical protein
MFFSLVLVELKESVCPSPLAAVVVPLLQASARVLPIFVAAPTILVLLHKVVVPVNRLLPVLVPMSLVTVLVPQKCSVVSVAEEDALLDPRSAAVVIRIRSRKD